jgi:hypothetical protein
MRVRHVLGLLAFALLPSSLVAQGGCPALQAGSTVRLYAPAAATYILPQPVRPTDSAIILPPVGRAVPAPLPCADLQRVQLRTDASRGRSALRGAGIGLLAGAVLGAGLFYATYTEDDSGWDIIDRDEAALIGAVFGGGTGGVIGGVAGYLTAPSEWRDVPVHAAAPRASAQGLRIAPAGGAGMRVSYTLSF